MTKTQEATFIYVPISIGEFLDKITILRLKQKFISSPQMLQHVEKELLQLLLVGKQWGLDEQGPLVQQLSAVNALLWQVEERLRGKEREQSFDEEFIQLARSVYIYNDQRFLLKREINALYNSPLWEEKSYGQPSSAGV